jgi:histidinol-phosphate aminotransferase
VFFHSGMPIEKLHGEMKSKGVLVGREFPPFNDWCRISTGTLEEMERFNTALRSVYA